MNVSLADAIQTYARIGCLSFGGPAGQIAMMHKVFVDEKKWISDKDYLAALNFCMLLPGPEAMQLATYVGWKMHGVRGGLAAGLLFVLPGAAVVLALTMIYAAFGQVPWIAALFYGVKAAVLAIVIEALVRVARRALKTSSDWWIAALAFVAIYVFGIPFPIVIIAAAVFGFIRVQTDNTSETKDFPAIGPFLSTVALWLAIWIVPLAALVAMLGSQHVLSEIALFFSKLAVVTFGGAYAVLSYMSQAAVEQQGWLKPQEMIDGLGLAETTPGPLILVTQFVGYIAALRETGSIWGGIAGAAVTLWATFAPCFMFIFAGAPYIEAINSRPRLKGALAAITAAVVGVILNLSLWFGLHILFGKVARTDGWFTPWLPDVATIDPAAVVLCAIAAAALLKLHLGLVKTLALSAILGLAWRLYITP
jgi:chromate transporter